MGWSSSVGVLSDVSDPPRMQVGGGRMRLPPSSAPLPKRQRIVRNDTLSDASSSELIADMDLSPSLSSSSESMLPNKDQVLIQVGRGSTRRHWIGTGYWIGTWTDLTGYAHCIIIIVLPHTIRLTLKLW
jgi:hypothetical protein